MTVHSQYAPGYPCPTQSLCKTEVAHLRCDDLGNYAWSLAVSSIRSEFRLAVKECLALTEVFLVDPSHKFAPILRSDRVVVPLGSTDNFA